MRLWISILVLSVLSAACVSTGAGLAGTVQGASGSFVATTVEVENRLFYALNRIDGTLGGFIYGEAGEEDGHDHEHDHDKLLFQEEEEEEEEFEYRQLDGFPLALAGNPVDIAIQPQGFLLFSLSGNGTVRVLEINGVTGLLANGPVLNTGMAGSTRLAVSGEGNILAVIGPQTQILFLGPGGVLEEQQTINGAADQVAFAGQDLLMARNDGVSRYALARGTAPQMVSQVGLPNSMRGGLVVGEDIAFVTNTTTNSVTSLDLSGGGLMLQTTEAIQAPLGAPETLAINPEGDHLIIASGQTVGLFHLDGTEIEQEQVLDIETGGITTILFLPETVTILVGHNAGDHMSALHFEDDGLELLEEPVEAGDGPSAIVNTIRVDQSTVIQDL